MSLNVPRDRALPVVRTLIKQRDSARRWSAAWKRAAKSNRAWRHTVAEIAAKQIMEHARCQEERDAARAQLANAAAKEVDAVQGRQECEEELREAREQLRLLAECFLNSAPIAGEMTFDQRREALHLAQSIVEEDESEIT